VQVRYWGHSKILRFGAQATTLTLFSSKAIYLLLHPYVLLQGWVAGPLIIILSLPASSAIALLLGVKVLWYYSTVTVPYSRYIDVIVRNAYKKMIIDEHLTLLNTGGKKREFE
jgi:antibiotic biosynthesis monooxygenase (ABM) superfamily enzyme